MPKGYTVEPGYSGKAPSRKKFHYIQVCYLANETYRHKNSVTISRFSTIDLFQGCVFGRVEFFSDLSKIYTHHEVNPSK